jgi:PH/SEC7 domain-containing protein
VDAEVVRFDLGDDLDYQPLSLSDQTASTADWSNCLDDAIALFENEAERLIDATKQDKKFLMDLPPLPVSLSHNLPTFETSGLAVSRSTEKITYNRTSRQATALPVSCVRASKSQENCLQCTGGSGVTLVNIDVDASSASLNALHYDPSASSASLNSLGYVQFVDCAVNNKPPVQREKQLGLVFVRAPVDGGDVALSSNQFEVDSKCNGLPPALSFDQTVLRISTDAEMPMLDGELDSESDELCIVSENLRPSQTDRKMTADSPIHQMPNKSISMAGVCPLDFRENETHVNINTTSTLPGIVASSSPDIVAEVSRPQSKDVDRPSACRLAKRLYHLDGFRKSDVAKHLCKKNDFSYLVGEEYVHYFDFTGLTLDAALREFLRKLMLSGETQERERILAHFSKRYLECNCGAYNSEDACHTLTCAIMLLNTDLHRQNVGRKMTLSEFIDNLSDLNDGDNFPRDVLSHLYQSIRTEPIEFEIEEDAVDEMNPSPGIQQDQFCQGIGHNPFLDVPDPSKTVEYKKGYVMRKCCTDPDGRKTALGRRGWKMCFATLCDMVLYLHKDERSFKHGAPVGAVSNALRIHHALATPATDYTKKQHVFRLQMSDWSQCLFQTSSSDECQSWISAINYVAAALSAPPLPGAVGSQKKFQRPLMPCSYTRLSLKEQLAHHQHYLEQVQRDLAEHSRNPPERGSKTRIIQEYVEKETYLQFEQDRFRTYCTVLHMRLCTPLHLGHPMVPESVISSLGSDQLSVITSSIGEVDEQTQLSPVHSTNDGRDAAPSSPSPSSAGSVQRSVSDSRKLHAFRDGKDYVDRSPPRLTLANGSVGVESPSSSLPNAQQPTNAHYSRSPRYMCMTPARSVPFIYETRV